MGTLSVQERFAAWLVTGPVGHLVAAVADLTAFAYGLGKAKVADSTPPGARRP